MTPRIETHRTISGRSLAAVAASLTLGLATAALAVPVTFNLNYTTLYGEGTAVGTFSVDSSLLVPGVETQDLANLLCLNLTITVPGATAQTFTKADLDNWYFRTHPETGAVTGATFGMDPDSRCPGYGFIIIDVDPFEFCVYDCDGPFGPSDPSMACFGANPVEGGVCVSAGEMAVPALSRAGIAALLLLVGAAAALALKR